MPETTWPPTEGRVPPAVAIALLESLRVADTPPEETSPDEDLPDIASALPHRLGLSAAVEDQMHRYARRKSDLPVQEVASLLRLIGRRPDARRVFSEAGRRIARRELGEGRFGLRAGAGRLPQGARSRLALRRVRRIARSLNPGAEVRTERKPLALVIAPCLPARAVAGDAGCALLEGAMTSVLEAYGSETPRVGHPSCQSRGDGSCVWKLEGHEG